MLLIGWHQLSSIKFALSRVHFEDMLSKLVHIAECSFAVRAFVRLSCHFFYCICNRIIKCFLIINERRALKVNVRMHCRYAALIHAFICDVQMLQHVNSLSIFDYINSVAKILNMICVALIRLIWQSLILVIVIKYGVQLIIWVIGFTVGILGTNLGLQYAKELCLQGIMKAIALW